MSKMLWKNIAPYDPCPCGSGEKYKFCCRKAMQEEERKTKRARSLPRRRVGP